MNKLVFVFGLMATILMLFSSCYTKSSENNEQSEIEKRNPIIGVWKSTYVSAKFASINGTEQDTFFEVTQPDFMEVLGISNNIGYYFEDGSYIEKYYDKNDSLFMEAKGRWRLMGDSIQVMQRNPTITTNKLHFKMEREFGTFTGAGDWDRDGLKDDFYVAVAEKIDADPMPKEKQLVSE